jgi:hypothetical protein
MKSTSPGQRRLARAFRKKYDQSYELWYALYSTRISISMDQGEKTGAGASGNWSSYCTLALQQSRTSNYLMLFLLPI